MSQVEHQYQIIFDTPGRVDSGSLLLGLHSAARELHPYHRAAASLRVLARTVAGSEVQGPVSRQDLFIWVAPLMWPAQPCYLPPLERHFAPKPVRFFFLP